MGRPVAYTTLDDGSGALLDLETSEYFDLNATGALLWQRLQAGDDRAALAAGLVSAFEVDAATADEVVAGFLQTLTEAGFWP